MKAGFKVEQFSYHDGSNYLDVESHGEEGVELKIEHVGSEGVRFDEKSWKELNKRVLELFKQEK